MHIGLLIYWMEREFMKTKSKNMKHIIATLFVFLSLNILAQTNVPIYNLEEVKVSRLPTAPECSFLAD